MRSSQASYKLVQSRPWEPGVLKQLPWLGLSALLGAFLCAIATAVILKSSNGRLTDAWPTKTLTVQPTVLLALLTAAANALLQYAFHEGCTVAWWLKALEGGDVNEFHRYWAYGA